MPVPYPIPLTLYLFSTYPYPSLALTLTNLSAQTVTPTHLLVLDFRDDLDGLARLPKHLSHEANVGSRL